MGNTVKGSTYNTMRPLTQSFRLFGEHRVEPSFEEERVLENINQSLEDPARPICISWNDNDLENPQNWPRRKKAVVALVISYYSFIVYCGSSIILPSYEGIIVRFGISRETASLVLSMYVLGYGVGALVFSPLSEIAFIGRNPPYIVSFIVFLILSVILGVLDNFPALVVVRFLQGFFGSPCLATGGASISDVYSLDVVAYGYTIWVACIYAAPGLGPLLGTVAVKQLGWHWSLWEIAIMAAPLLPLITLALPETSHEAILLRRAQRLRQQTGNQNISTAHELSYKGLYAHMTNALVRPAEIALKDPAIAFVCVYCSFIYGIYYSFFEVFPLVYPVVYHMSSIPYATIFVSAVVGTMIAIVPYVLYLRFWSESPSIIVRANRHEDALLPARPAVIIATVGLFIFAWTARESINWAVPTVGITLYSGATFVIFQTMLIYIPQSYPMYVASLLAASDFTRSATAAVLIMVCPYMYENLGIAHGVTVLASISILGIVGVYVLYRYGAQMRARSRFTMDESQVSAASGVFCPPAGTTGTSLA